MMVITTVFAAVLRAAPMNPHWRQEDGFQSRNKQGLVKPEGIVREGSITENVR
jgi:hypothetical protein